ncbi:hypothetical protein [Acinetobacter sp. MD2]|uniref:hypothetical protein n=1 Tax=Acinetobacter sp. MD2 TaxID=2600066 RepID=UPI002D1EFEA1|nr:hypothetical protein [Acinetobacter sp. MD2]MEB3767470.1 hypothetical protein [Acinetobacter sp. MD2]
MTQLSYSADTEKHYYRYYDTNGIASISSSVSPIHIQRGYDVLNANMQLLRHVQPFTQHTAQQSKQREQQSKQRLADQQLKNAYTNSQTAYAKKQESLSSIQKQINLQQKQLNNLYQDQISTKRQEQDYLRQNQNPPAIIKTRIQQNDLRLNQVKQRITSLQAHYRETQQEYDDIILRLKRLE